MLKIAKIPKRPRLNASTVLILSAAIIVLALLHFIQLMAKKKEMLENAKPKVPTTETQEVEPINK